MRNSRLTWLIAAVGILCGAVPSASVVAQSGGVALPSPCANVKGTKTLKQTTKQGLRSEIGCKGGLQHGPYIVWHQNGTKISEGEYRDGFRIKTHRSWHPNGKRASIKEYGPPAPPGAQIRQTSWNVEGKLNFYAEWSPDNEPIYQLALDKNGERILELGVPKTPPKDLPDFGDLIPKPILDIAEKYVIAQVGRSYFARNYKFVEAASQYGQSGAEVKQYGVVFDYAPLRKIGARSFVTTVITSSGKTIKPYGYVADVRKDQVVEPQISRQQALRILRQKVKFDPSKTYVRLVTPYGLAPKVKTFSWSIAVPLKSENDLTGIFTHFVDAVTGEILQ
jgi:hypothetical protein